MLSDTPSSVVQENPTIDSLGENNSDTDCEEVVSEMPIRLNDAIIAINQIRKYVTQCNATEESHVLINKLENDIYKQRNNILKQLKITDFMSTL